MQTRKLPLEELSISQIYNEEQATYEVPIYQRNYAWQKEEIAALVQDVYDAYSSKKPVYFIGTLVSFHKGDNVYEVIDGQQRLTTINITLKALGVPLKNKLTFRARKKSDVTINRLPVRETLIGNSNERKKIVNDAFALIDFNLKEEGIVNGFHFSSEAINEIVPSNDLENFKNYFLNQVHIIHYKVPKDIDLNHYFEIMNSRGEQLEKHEIIKARFIEVLDDKSKEKFNTIWECCTEMNVYIQQKYRDPNLFGNSFSEFKLADFDSLPEEKGNKGDLSISELLNLASIELSSSKKEKLDSFQAIIDFSNFLLIVLKITRMEEDNFEPHKFILDDKELLREFDKVTNFDIQFAKRYGYNLLKAKYLLDNYIIHHDNNDDKIDNNPWKLQVWCNEGKNEYPKNLADNTEAQHKLVQLLSMFEVTFTARQRKNYLFYCLYYLFNNDISNINAYSSFVSDLAKKYFFDVYLLAENLNSINVPSPGSFDKMIVEKERTKENKGLNRTIQNTEAKFSEVYGDGTKVSAGIPLFVFNYLDYKIWELYYDELRGEKTKEGSDLRNKFFDKLGCSDFGLETFQNFYFSRTRRSLEHFYPTANAKGDTVSLSQEQINCFGNYAMIGSEVNSSGNSWSPKTKLLHYLDSSGKIKLVSVASLKFMVMMQICNDNEHQNRTNGLEWDFEDIIHHQEKMEKILNA